MDGERINRVRERLAADNLDALVLQLPEHILMTFGFWPMNGMTFGVFTREDGPLAVFAPSCEDAEMGGAWAKDVRVYRWPLLVMDDPADFVRTNLRDVLEKRGLLRGRLGYEGAVGSIAPPHNAGELVVPWQMAAGFLDEAVPEAQWSDAVPLLDEQRATKTSAEIDRLAVAHQVAAFGIRAFEAAVRAGVSEAELAAEVYRACLTQGVDLDGVQHVNVYPQISSGLNGCRAWRPIVTTGSRRVEQGEFVVLELGVCVDGFWADVTRTVGCGELDETRIAAMKIVSAAQQAAIDALGVGVAADAVHEAATQVLIDGGFAEQVTHITGHGLGFRYHEATPFLMPGNTQLLEIGHVFSVEPGLYSPDFGGVRQEDNVVITQTGIRNLTTQALAKI